MKWIVSFYNQKVVKILDEWPIGIRSKFVHIVDLLIEYGPQYVAMPLIKPMGDGIFEIRAKGKEGIGRALFCVYGSREILILHAFIKKTQETPLKELMITKKRYRDIQNEKKTNI